MCLNISYQCWGCAVAHSHRDCDAGKKVRYHKFCMFLQGRRTIIPQLFVLQEGALRFQIFSGIQVCLKNKIFFQHLKKSYFSTSRKKRTKDTRQIAKSHDFPGINSLNQILPQKILCRAFYHIRLTLLIVISVVPISVNH